MSKKSRARTETAQRKARDLDFQISFLEGVIRRDPEYSDALYVLGDCYTRRGRTTDGLKVDERLSQLQPSDPVVHYNLACSYSLTGAVDRAAGALQRALELGFRDFRWLAEDPDLQNLRQDPIYQKIQSRIQEITIRVE